ncbi:MAG: ParB-like protein partition protein [Candidatus Woesebacteria bacterium GW2011_GWB1_45_5]|uniref:ParB-like protein partition protein n=1 Tax=Candidatus Woesebacteria bacterium GW2011_GWB1_45_5 TaxID=1618581 RepID=A0A0G1MR47_9BACT|nr:MAG: ParB-like protein partition protein [Candidatus Woesebacteria bacterium GW2011_GWB1_45_5]
MVKLKRISIAKISPNPNQPRKSIYGLGDLAKNIEENGLLNPISVEKAKGNKYRIISGERRWGAHKKLGWKKILCIVKKPTEYEMLAENLMRQEMSLIEVVDGCVAALQKKFPTHWKKSLAHLHIGNEISVQDLPVKKACSSIGIAPGTLYCSLPVADLNESTKKLALDHPEYFGAATLRKLATVKETKKQIYFAEKIIKEEWTVNQTISAIARYHHSGNDWDLDFENLLRSIRSVKAGMENIQTERQNTQLGSYAPIIREKLRELKTAFAEFEQWLTQGGRA